MVERPEDYRWSSIGYHAQTGNKDNLLSVDFGLKEFGELIPKERFRRYRRYLYEVGAIDKRGKRAKIDERVVESERKKRIEVSWV